ncbi:MAG: carboxyl transferase domain-containing protein, partial [Rhodothermales bacterium]
QIAAADDPEALEKEFVDQYREKFANPYIAAERGYIDDVILPGETRYRLIRGLDMLKNKVANNPRKKHGNIPL